MLVNGRAQVWPGGNGHLLGLVMMAFPVHPVQVGLVLGFDHAAQFVDSSVDHKGTDGLFHTHVRRFHDFHLDAVGQCANTIPVQLIADIDARV